MSIRCNDAKINNEIRYKKERTIGEIKKTELGDLKMDNRSTKQSKMMLITAMVIFGTIGIFRKYIPLPSSVLAMARGFIGALFLLVFVLIRGKKISLRAIKANWISLLFSGAFIGVNWILLFESYQYTTVATATLCYYMAPVIVIMAAPIFFKEHLTIKKLICVAVALVGMVLVSGVLQAGAGGVQDIKGIMFGLGAAAFYASVILLNKTINDISTYDKTIIQLAAATIVVLPYTLATENLNEIAWNPTMIIMLLIVGVLHTGITYAMYFGTITVLKAQTVALFSYIDPIVAIILSATVLQENIGMEGIIGACLVLGATLVSELSEG